MPVCRLYQTVWIQEKALFWCESPVFRLPTGGDLDSSGAAPMTLQTDDARSSPLLSADQMAAKFGISCRCILNWFYDGRRAEPHEIPALCAELPVDDFLAVFPHLRISDSISTNSVGPNRMLRMDLF